MTINRISGNTPAIAAPSSTESPKKTIFSRISDIIRPIIDRLSDFVGYMGAKLTSWDWKELTSDALILENHPLLTGNNDAPKARKKDQAVKGECSPEACEGLYKLTQWEKGELSLRKDWLQPDSPEALNQETNRSQTFNEDSTKALKKAQAEKGECSPSVYEQFNKLTDWERAELAGD